jgi:hypothetical protein
MAIRYAHSATITAERAVGCLGQRVTQTLISGGTLDRLVDGRLQGVERNELVKSADRHGFVPAISRSAIAEAFNNNNRAQQVKHRSGANEIVKTSHLSANLLLRSVAVHSAKRAAAAHWKIWSRTIRRRRDRKQWWQQLGGRRRQHRARWNPIVMQTLDGWVWPLGRSILLWRTGRLPLGREE